jgi:hypothetical protein
MDAAYNKELITAAHAADFGKVSELLARGADAKYVDESAGIWGSCDRKSALHMALSHPAVVHADAKKVVLALLAAGADVNALRKNYDWRGCGHSNTAFEMLLGACVRMDVSMYSCGCASRCMQACMQDRDLRSALTQLSSRPS